MLRSTTSRRRVSTPAHVAGAGRRVHPNNSECWCLARNPAGEALMDEVVEIAEVTDRDREAALQGQVEACIILFRRRRNAAAPWDAVRVLGKGRRGQGDSRHGQ